MSVYSISSSNDEISLDRKDEREESQQLEVLSQKTQGIWARVYDLTIGNCSKVIHVLRSAIGSMVRDVFFFPLKWSWLANRSWVQEQLLVEETFYRNFWDSDKPLDPNFPEQAKIREVFAPPEDRPLSVQLKNGTEIEILCRVIQTKEAGEKFYNFAQVPGVQTTISNNMGGLYPYLAAYLNLGQDQTSLPPARFIIICENNLNFKPASLEEAGFILLEVLKKLHAEFGDIDQLVAHSIGNIFMGSALKQATEVGFLPKRICLDRGPTSLYEASKKYFWGLGSWLYFLFRWGGWGSDVEQEVVEFCEKWPQRPSFTVIGVEQDHYFSGSANLCLGQKIQKVNGIDFLLFDPPLQFVHEYAHHTLRPDFLHPLYLTVESDFMRPSENLAEAIIRHSFQK